jgi:hypothetical protein
MWLFLFVDICRFIFASNGLYRSFVVPSTCETIVWPVYDTQRKQRNLLAVTKSGALEERGIGGRSRTSDIVRGWPKIIISLDDWFFTVLTV